MADEEERIGGISIEASITDERVDAELNALLGKLKAAAEQMSAALIVHPTITAPTQAQVRQAQQPPPQAASVTYRGASAPKPTFTGGDMFKDPFYAAQIKQGLAAQGADLVDGVLVEVEQGKKETTRRVAAAVSASGPQGDTAGISISVSTDEAKAALAAFLSEFKTEMAAAQEAATIVVKVDRPAAQTAAAGGGGRRRGGRAGASAPPPDDDESSQVSRAAPRRKNVDRTQGAAEEREEEQGRIGFQTRMAAFEWREADRTTAGVQQRRRTAAQRAFTESERARRTELVATSKHYDTLAALATDYFDDQAARADRAQGISAKADEQRRLKELSYEAEHEPRQAQAATGFAGRQRTPQEIEEFRRASAAASAAARNQPPPDPERVAAERRARSERLARQNEQRRASAQEAREDATGSATGRGAAAAAGRRGPAVRRTEEDIARREAERIASSEAQTFTAGRTLRTFESSLGGFLAGGRARVEAQAALAAANEKVRISQDRLREPDVLRSRRATAQATEELTAAENERARALERVQSFSGPTAAIRTFAGIGVATVGFSLALKGVGVALDAIGPALADFIDMQTGFAAKSTAVTSAIAQQTVAQKGNVDAVLAQQAATAGLSGTTAQYIDSQLKLTAQVKAGALAEKQSSDLFKAAQGTNQNVPQGLNGGFGGLFGTPFLAEQFGGGPGFRETVAGNVRQSAGSAVSTTGRFGDVPGTINDILGSLNPFGENFANPGLQIQKRDAAATLAAGDTPALTKQIDDLNASEKRAAAATGQNVAATFAYTNNTKDIAQAVAIAKAAGDDLGASMASMGLVVRDASGNIADFKTQVQAWSQAAVGQGIPAAESLTAIAKAQETQREKEAAASVPALQQQFAYERPAFLAGLERQQQFQLNQQLPAQAALQNLANPPQRVGTGIVAANADEQKRIEESARKTRDIQKELNTYYAQGEQVLSQTYQIPPALIASIRAVGTEIANVQSGIRNEQAAYQVAQYNFQLQIAKRSLSDIGGLTGKNFGAGQSYLGILERQNLALSRQGQLLQFNLQQRQINFQTAVAGFQAPGVTPEERQANIAEAKLEASYAQKQLDIQRQMFGNQVQIVDIQNLRQGADLARQIGLLLQGRKVTIDTALAEERLIRLNQLQQKQVAEAGTYISKVDAAVGRAFSEIQSLETAAGKAMFNAAKYAASAFNIYLAGVIVALNQTAHSYADLGRAEQGTGPTSHAASGALFNTGGGPVGMMTVGENDRNETVAVLRNPRAAVLGGGGGGNLSITFGDVYVRNDSDIDAIARKVTQTMGRDAALKGLRSTS